MCIVCKKRERQTERQPERQTERQTERQPERQTDRETDREADRETARETDREADRETERERDSETERERERKEPSLVIMSKTSNLFGVHSQDRLRSPATRDACTRSDVPCEDYSLPCVTAHTTLLFLSTLPSL